MSGAVKVLGQAALSGVLAAIGALATCEEQKNGLECCAVDSDQYHVGDQLNGKIVVAIITAVGAAATMLGSRLLITSKAKSKEEVTEKQIKAVEELDKKLESVQQVNVKVLPAANTPAK